MFFSQNFKINNPKKAQNSSILILNLAEKITKFLKVLDEEIASNRRNKSVFSRLRVSKITVGFCV
ncbi:hypothetical protein M2254_001325 [Chryseobacterium sp. BIGb0186]|nr:hypothetical protein [Chryseobacterium sp. JUb44]MDH6209741.1 hypothetical protein [Chryseobacterium sp. BIGb0186]